MISSDLYSFNPDLILFFKSSHKLLQKYNSQNLHDKTFADDQIYEIKEIMHSFQTILILKLFFIITQKLMIMFLEIIQIKLKVFLISVKS